MGHLPRLIVFDLDGTLVDSRQDLADAANALIAERGGSPLPATEIVAMVGEGAAVLVERALTAAQLPFDRSSVRRFLELYDARLLRTTRPYPGVPEMLTELQRHASLAVLTNKPLAPTHAVLDGLDLAGAFAAVLGGDGPLPRKPDPASLRHLMAAFAADPADAVLVGDSHVDLHTAHAAGIPVCLARYGFGYPQISAASFNGREMFVSSAAEIPHVLRGSRRV